MRDKNMLSRLADFAYEAAMLKDTPRSGFAFLGSGGESVADHSFGTAILGLVLAKLAGADAGRTITLCLLHDLHEAATGDFNYVNHRYDVCRAEAALADAVAGTGLENEICGACSEFESCETLEAKLAADADQLDLICALRRQLVIGNQFASEWLDSAVKRIKTEAGKELCAALMETDPNNWWYGQVDKSWWVNRGG